MMSTAKMRVVGLAQYATSRSLVDRENELRSIESQHPSALLQLRGDMVDPLVKTKRGSV
jgi:hypothetical protein